MASEKVASSRISWAHALNTDTAKSVVPLLVPSRPSFSAALHLGAHVHRIPEKYEFSVLLGGLRVAALDINPAGGHLNFSYGRKESVRITHWHCWPAEDVEPDTREMRFRPWLNAFCKRFKVTLNGVGTPPHYGGEQMRLF